MERHWVREAGWATAEDLKRGLALSTLCPGPVGSQLAAYLGRLRGGAAGAAASLFSFLFPSFVLVVAIAALYDRWGGRPGPRAFAAGAGCAVVVIVFKSAGKLTKTLLGPSRSSWAIAALAAAITLLRPTAATPFILLAAAACSVADSRRGAASASAAAWLGLAFMGLKAGLLTFGTGLAILPVMRAHAVGHGWVTDPQFVDAISAGMVTPGPIVMAAAFVGYVYAGLIGAVCATLGLFLPVLFLTLLLAPVVDKHSERPALKGFARGAMAAAMGSIVAAAIAMAGATLTSPLRWALAAVSAAALFGTKIPDPLVLLAAGAVGVFVL